VRQLAAAFDQASLLAVRTCDISASEQARPRESGGKPPHSKAPSAQALSKQIPLQHFPLDNCPAFW